MSSLSYQASNKLIDYLLRGQALSFLDSAAAAGTGPSVHYVGLTTTASTSTAFGTEPSGGGYARVAVASSLASWSGTQGAGTTSASTGTSETTSNNIAIVFPAPTAAWGTIVGFVIYDSLTGGTPMYYGSLQTPKNVNSGDAPPAFAAGVLTIQYT